MKAQGFILSELWYVGPRSDVMSFKRHQKHLCVGSDKIQRPEERFWVIFVHKNKKCLFGEVWGTMAAEKRDYFPQETVSELRPANDWLDMLEIHYASPPSFPSSLEAQASPVTSSHAVQHSSKSNQIPHPSWPSKTLSMCLLETSPSRCVTNMFP